MSASVLIDVGDINAAPGSKPWAVAMRLKIYNELREHEASVEHAKQLLELMELHCGYKELEDAHGKPFKDLAAFCTAKPPYGLGYSPDLIQRIKDEANGQKPLWELAKEAEAKPLAPQEIGIEGGKPGPGRGNKTVANSHGLTPANKQSSTSRDRLTRRIARDKAGQSVGVGSRSIKASQPNCHKG